MPLVATMFLMSGAAALVYEIVWMRQLSLILGITTVAVSTVIAIFMGGLAIGSVLIGRRSDKTSRPLILYAMLEIGIGIYALIIPNLFAALQSSYISLYRLDLPYGAITLGRVLLSSIVLLPPTIFMGGTLPVLAKYLIHRYGDAGKQTGILYFFNTLGAVIGCCVAGFYLIENLGLIASTYIAATINFGLAATAIGLQYSLAYRVPQASESSASAEIDGPPISKTTARLILICIGLSGFVSLASEVLWTRALPRYIFNSTYAYTTVLAVFLLGLAIGSSVYLLLPFRKSHPLLIFSTLEAGAGLGFLFSLHLFENLRETSTSILGASVESFGDSIALMVVRSGLVIFLPALCYGATLPLATQMCARGTRNIGSLIGRVYAVNTIGAVLGSLGVTFVLIPALGMHRTVMLFVVTSLLIALVLAGAGFRRGWLKTASLAAVCAAFALAYALTPADVFLRTFGGFGTKTIYYRDGLTDTVGVIEDNKTGHRTIQYADLRGTSATWRYPWEYTLGHLPILLHPGEPKKGLHICFGVGNSLSAMAALETMESIDSVELSPHVLEAAKYFWTNNDVVSNPKITTIVDDGRNFVMATESIYDVIEISPPYIFTAGVINLYTRDFYEDIYKCLAEDGVFLQWMPTEKGSIRDEQMLLRAFYDVFPHTTVWKERTVTSALLVIGTKKPLKIDYQLLGEKMRRRYAREDLALAKLHDAVDLLAMFLFGPKELEKYVRGVPPVTENKTVVDFSMPRQLASGFGLGAYAPDSNVESVPKTVLAANRDNFLRTIKMRTSILQYLTNLGDEDPEELERKILDHGVDEFVGKYVSEAKWNRWPDE